MSEYGRRWEDIREIRAELRRLMPTVSSHFFDASTTRLVVDEHCAQLQRLMTEWEELEDR